ncbi:MAG: aminotransferase class V-fold PLP-dependent enzyme [Proteobacteria bacterium]|nr:aminotransferase class V-fold PLP-dependent enzyme [Pseudomonadota bacterium]NOG59397.1 aminotransferase class V-fold PLP-dependent enzyme [Pseudomonadota bacterium]
MDKIISEEFPLDEDIVYLNHAAVSPWPLRTSHAVKAFSEENTYFGARNYLTWLDTEKRLRGQLQRLINAPSSNDIALLKNTSEALSVVASGLNWQSGDNIVSSNEEFPSNRFPWLAQARHGVEFREIDLTTDVSPEQALINACDNKTRLITISSVQYGTGKVINLKQLGDFCSENNILFCVDAIQSLGALPFDVQSINADFVMADAHKWMLGPEGIALFYCKEEVRDLLELHQFGWHMVKDVGNYTVKDWQVTDTAQRFECGSPNMLGIHALSASLSLIEEVGIEKISRNIINNTSYIIDNIKNIENLIFISPSVKPDYAGIVTFSIEAKDMNQLYSKLMKNNVICANRAGGLRFSPHFYTSQKCINKGLEILYSII